MGYKKVWIILEMRAKTPVTVSVTVSDSMEAKDS